MLDKNSLKESARKAFVAQMRELVERISEWSWTRHLEQNLKEVNRVILAAREMDVSQAAVFSTDEITELVADLSPLRTLEMKAEAKTHLIAALAQHGIEPEVFQEKVSV